MDKRGKTSRAILASVVILIILVAGLLIYFNRGPSIDINASHCKITSDLENIQLSLGVSSSLSVSGYQGTLDKVSWTSEDENVATVNPVSGQDVFVKAEGVGTTSIIAIDNAVSNECTVSIPVAVN